MESNIQPSTPEVVPEQEKSLSKEHAHSVTFDTVADAEEAFLDAKDRLLKPGVWQHIAGDGTAEFAVCNATGSPVSHTPRVGDLLRISIPGPGHTGNPYDWVRVEAVVYDDFPDEDRERMTLQVRPTAAPGGDGDKPQHFFSEDATSTFAIERAGRRVMAGYWGRNEVPNFRGENFLDAARNVAVAIGGLLGASDAQWKALVRGLLEPADRRA